ncbi:hypothetical protein HKD37_11G031417 [Glycine soja]
MSIEELIQTLKVHKQELQQDEGFKKGKSLALTTHKAKASPTCNESSSRLASISSSKAINTDTSYDDKSDDESSYEDDQLAFISRKIRKMWKKKRSKKPYRERNNKDRSSIICYKCKKLGHFKSECPDLDKLDHNKIYFKPKDKKVLISTWKELNDTSSDEETKKKEEANPVNINNHETLLLAYHELLSNSPILSKAYQNLRKEFKKIFTQSCDDFESLKLKTTKLHLKNEETCQERPSLLEDLQKLKNQLEGLQNKYITLNKLHDCLNEEMRYKKSLKFLNDKFEQYEILQKQPQNKHYPNFLEALRNLTKMLRYNNCPTDEFGNGYKGKRYVHDEETIVCYCFGNIGHMTSKC